MKESGRPKPWVAYINVQERTKHVGSYATEMEAARAYDKAAMEHRKGKVILNFPHDNDGDDDESKGGYDRKPHGGVARGGKKKKRSQYRGEHSVNDWLYTFCR